MSIGNKPKLVTIWPLHYLLATLLCFGVATSGRADAVDDVILAQLKRKGIPGLSLAVVDGGKIVKQQGYGFTDESKKTPVTPSTLFQVGSVSKAVAALGALRLVDKKQLSLDEDVNIKLRSWTLPPNKFTERRKVTLRLILSHTAGLTVHGFPGYAVGKPVPTLTQVLNGEKPANSAAIRVDRTPGSEWRYSGGGYVIVQQMLNDVTGKPFPQFMEEAVLKPFGMTSSSYVQALPEDVAVKAAKGYGGIFGQSVKGGWHVYPEMAAAGLWTTAGDLARFAIGIQKAVSGESNPVISQSLAQEMVTSQQNNDGLGLFVQGSGKTLRFGHEGTNAGYQAAMTAYAHVGKGAVIILNKNTDTSIMSAILSAIRKEYEWPDDHIPNK